MREVLPSLLIALLLAGLPAVSPAQVEDPGGSELGQSEEADLEEPQVDPSEAAAPEEPETAAVEEPEPEPGRVFYVRQTVGSDANSGTSPETAWQSIGELSEVLRAGDTAYVGPGLYRDKIVIGNDGAPGNPIRIIADTTGQFTGDPPGVVMIAGSDPVDETIFTPHERPGVYSAVVPQTVVGVVEMDGPQYRYKRARDTKEFLREGLSKLEVVAGLPSSYFFDPESDTVYLHTSDGQHPSEHEIEFIHRGNGILVHGHHYVTIVGFTLRHMGDGGLSFWWGASHIAAINNTSWGGRQGVRVYNATDILVVGNTFFRNDNSGVYFAKESLSGFAIGNTSYENIKGVRWSSASNNGLALDNSLFDNHEAGIAIEKADGVRIAGNRLVGNPSQLLVFSSEFESDGNCFQTRSSEQLVALLEYTHRYTSLADYQAERKSDQGSREGDCGPVKKIDVQELHAATMSYAAKARELLGKSEPEASN